MFTPTLSEMSRECAPREQPDETYGRLHSFIMTRRKKESKDDEELEYEFITEKVRVIHISIQQLNSLSACVTSSPPSLHYSSRKRCRNRDT